MKHFVVMLSSPRLLHMLSYIRNHISKRKRFSCRVVNIIVVGPLDITVGFCTLSLTVWIKNACMLRVFLECIVPAEHAKTLRISSNSEAIWAYMSFGINERWFIFRNESFRWTFVLGGHVIECSAACTSCTHSNSRLPQEAERRFLLWTTFISGVLFPVSEPEESLPNAALGMIRGIRSLHEQGVRGLLTS